MNKFDEMYDKYIEIINRHFCISFDAIYKSYKKSDKLKLQSSLANIYRRWYYSSFIENSYLTPANILEALNRKYSLPPDLAPVVQLKSHAKYAGLNFIYQEYNKNTHPIVNDYRKIINFCRPGIHLTETDQMPEYIAETASHELHLNDPCYAMYLVDIALDMGLLIKTPSIHVNRAQLAPNAEKTVAASDNIIFDKIVNSTFSHASKTLSELVPLPIPLFDTEYLTNILKEPVETDIIFQRLYDTLGVDINDLMGLDIFDEIDMLDMAVISGTYLLGVMIDKYFLTPFGHYLRLIRPMYIMPFDFKNEVSLYLDTNLEEDEIGSAFYAPCSCYHLTELGLEYFMVRQNPGNYLDIEKRFNFDDIVTFLSASGGVNNLTDIKSISEPFDRKINIYTIKVKYMADERLWLNIDVSDVNSLHRLFTELAYYYDLDKNSDYIFFPDETENPFVAFTSPSHKRKSKKASETSINNLGLKEKMKMVLSVKHPRIGNGSKLNEKWSLEVMKIHQGKSTQTYPAVVRVGKALREFFEWS